ncbi:MAG: hypothetical protein J0M37_09970 [Ignavibacteria bacterium]|nr:hypothetical protein [Ignavibacteria bacterium]
MMYFSFSKCSPPVFRRGRDKFPAGNLSRGGMFLLKSKIPFSGNHLNLIINNKKGRSITCL